MTSIQMPQLGETIVEGTILKWLKQEGETIAVDEPLFEISTDKVDTEVPSPVAGTVTKILVAEGETVAVGTPLAEIDGDTADSGDASAAVASAGPAPSDSATCGLRRRRLSLRRRHHRSGGSGRGPRCCRVAAFRDDLLVRGVAGSGAAVADPVAVGAAAGGRARGGPDDGAGHGHREDASRSRTC